MNLPNSISHSIICPSCGNPAELERQRDPSGYIYLSYYCNNCEEGWTTNESDELSLRIRKNKKRSERQKLKIKKIIKF